MDWLYPTLAAILAAAACLLVVWSLLWDRSRGRRRCPACWYDMSGSTGLAPGTPRPARCPECGHHPRNEGSFHRTRRRWGWFALAFLLALCAEGVRRTPDVQNEGWTRFVPTTAMILVPPISRDDVLFPENLPSSPVLSIQQTFLRRLSDRRLWDWQLKLWSLRLEFWEGEYARRDGGVAELTVIDCEWLMRSNRADNPGFDRSEEVHSSCFRQSIPYWQGQGWKRETSQDAARWMTDLVEQLIDPESWASNGGILGHTHELGEAIVIVNSRGVINEARELVRQIHAECQGTDRAADAERLARDRAGINALSHAMLETPRGPCDVGELLRQMNDDLFPGTRIVMTPEMQQRLSDMHVFLRGGAINQRAVLDTIEREILSATRFDFATWHVIDGHIEFRAHGSNSLPSPPSSLLVLDVGDILHRMQDEHASNGNVPSRAEVAMSLIDGIERVVEAERWTDNGGADLAIRSLQGKLIIKGYPRAHVAVADYLASLRNAARIWPELERTQ